MPYLDSFALVIFVFYLAGSFRLVSPHSVILRGSIGSTFKPHIAAQAGLKLRDHLFIVGTTIWPFGRASATEVPPFILHQGTLLAGPAHNFAPNPVKTEPRWRIFLKSGARFVCDGRTLIAPTQHALQFLSQESAQAACSLLELGGTDGAIRRWFRTSMEAKALQARFDLLTQHGWSLRISCTLLALFVFVGLPLTSTSDVHTYAQWMGPWHVLYAYTLLWSINTTLFWRLHARLYPNHRGARFKELLGMLVSPADAMGAHRRIWWDAFAQFHPILATRLLATPEDFQKLATVVYRGLDWANPPYCWPLLGQLLREELELRMEENQTKPLSQDGARSYCPRCETQLLQPRGNCPECLEVPVLAL